MSGFFIGVVWFFIIGRILIGLAPFVAVRPLIKVFQLPESENTANARLFARFFGVRDMGLGILVAFALSDREWLRWSFLFNACMDASDFFAVLLAIREKPELKKSFLMFGSFSFGGGLGWVVLYYWSAL